MTPPETSPRPAVHIPYPVYLYIIFDGPPSHESGRFVELEDENGQGVSAGKWEQRGDGLWSLGPFLQPPATVTIRPCSHCKEGWVCEAHPEKGWPHDDCAGPGMPCQRCTQASYPTTTEQPATDLGAMVVMIIHLTAVQEISDPAVRGALLEDGEVKELWRCAMIRAEADRLKVALEREQAVMGDMAKVLGRLDAFFCFSEKVTVKSPVELGPSDRLNEAFAEATTALAEYEKAHLLRETPHTEGEQ